MNKNPLDNEIKSILEEDSKHIRFSDELQTRILTSEKMTLRKRINRFLDREMEIPIGPVIVGFVALLAISILPRGIFDKTGIQVVNIGESQVLIKGERDVSRR